MTNSDPREQMTDGLDPRDQELIAAFIDRRMSAEERRAFMERLGSEEALYEVFVDTVRFRDQERARPAEVVEHPASRRRWMRPLAVAALLVVAVAAPLLLNGGRSEDFAGELVASERLGPSLGEAWYLPDWPRMRGIDSRTEGAQAAFRLGVQVVDLEIALRLGRAQDAVRVTYGLEQELGGIEAPFLLGSCYQTIRRLVEEGAQMTEAIAKSRSDECDLAAQDEQLAAAFRLGRWAEAGKLAAVSENRDLLSSRAFRRTLRDLRSQEWDAEIAEKLEEIAGLLDTPAARLDLSRAAAAFGELVAAG